MRDKRGWMGVGNCIENLSSSECKITSHSRISASVSSFAMFNNFPKHPNNIYLVDSLAKWNQREVTMT